jgi:hypothetical protein
MEPSESIALDGGEWSVSPPAALPPGKKYGTYSLGCVWAPEVI